MSDFSRCRKLPPEQTVLFAHTHTMRPPTVSTITELERQNQKLKKGEAFTPPAFTTNEPNQRKCSHRSGERPRAARQAPVPNADTPLTADDSRDPYLDGGLEPARYSPPHHATPRLPTTPSLPPPATSCHLFSSTICKSFHATVIPYPPLYCYRSTT